MFSAGRDVRSDPNGGFSVDPYEPAAVQMIHSVSWSGETCWGLEPPPNARAEVVRFPSGRLALLAPTDDIVVMRD